MGELHRKAHQPPPTRPELVTVTLTMHPAAWAALQMFVTLGSDNQGLKAQVQEAIGKAVVVQGGLGLMIADLAGLARDYDPEKITAELKDFFESPDEPDPGEAPSIPKEE